MLCPRRVAAFFLTFSSHQETSENIVHRIRQIHTVIIDRRIAHHRFQVGEIAGDRLAILPAHQVWVGHDGSAAFHVQKPRGPVKIKIDFTLIQ